MDKLFIFSIVLLCFTTSEAQTLSEQIQIVQEKQENLEQELTTIQSGSVKN